MFLQKLEGTAATKDLRRENSRRRGVWRGVNPTHRWFSKVAGWNRELDGGEEARTYSSSSRNTAQQQPLAPSARETASSTIFTRRGCANSTIAAIPEAGGRVGKQILGDLLEKRRKHACVFLQRPQGRQTVCTL